MTLLRAVAVAGGMGEYAKRGEVIVIRETDSQRYIGVYDVAGISRGNYPDPEIYPNDIIVVGDSPQLRLLGQISPLTNLVTSPILFFSRL
jgi:polysaccharide export outer membrane protein